MITDNVCKSIDRQRDVPSTFDGELPEYAFGPAKRPLTIGEQYELEVGDGRKILATLESATVNEKSRHAVCALRGESGESIMSTRHLTDLDVEAWRRNPETFFGVVTPQHRVQDSVELYDVILSSLANVKREDLLKALANPTTPDELQQLDDDSLRRRRAEQLAAAGSAHLFAKRFRRSPK